jgi:hypothetical protein
MRLGAAQTEGNMSDLQKAVLGAMGGLSAVLVKFLGQDYATVVNNAANLTDEQTMAFKVGYGLLTPILMFLGGFVAWASDETKRMKLIGLAIAAPALITTWAGGQKYDKLASLEMMIPSAYAQKADDGRSAVIPAASQPADDKAAGDSSVIDKIQKGVGIFFGYGKEPQRYWVIVGSFRDRDNAQRYADQINKEVGGNQELKAWVGIQAPGNPNYPVIVGGYSYLSDARETMKKALALDSVTDAYLSAGAKR